MPQSRENSIAFPLFMLLIAMISIQSGASLAKHIFPIIGSTATSALRLGIAAIILCCVWRPWRRSISRQAWLAILPYGISLGLMNLTFYLAIERIPLGIAVAIEFIGPLSVSLLASRKARDFLWAALASLGIYLILPMGEFSQPLDKLGTMYAFLAAICWALYIYFGQRAVSFIHGGLLTSVGMVLAALFVFPVGMIGAEKNLLTLQVLLFACGVAVFSSALPYSLEMIALKRISKKKFGILMSLEPALAALSGLFFLDEQLTLLQWSAIALVIAASLGTSVTGEKAPGAGL